MVKERNKVSFQIRKTCKLNELNISNTGERVLLSITNQRALQVESLGVLTQQHHILLQVVQAAVFVAADPLLMHGERNNRQQSDMQDLISWNLKKEIYIYIFKKTIDEVIFDPHLDLSEVHWFADELIILGKLFARWELDEDFAQLSAISAKTRRQVS